MSHIVFVVHPPYLLFPNTLVHPVKGPFGIWRGKRAKEDGIRQKQEYQEMIGSLNEKGALRFSQERLFFFESYLLSFDNASLAG